MVKTILFAVLMLVSATAAAAESFDQRVAIAKSLEDTPQGQAYDQILFGAIGEYIQKAMQKCFPRETKADTVRFTLVADILANKTAARVEVQPNTKMAACFRDKFVSAPFPALPAYAKEGTLPIFMDVKIEP